MYPPERKANPENLRTLSFETANIAVTVTDGTKPVSGVTVAVDEITGTTGSQGGCTLSDVPVGECTVTANKEGFEEYSKKMTITSETETLDIVLSKEEAI